MHPPLEAVHAEAGMAEFDRSCSIRHASSRLLLERQLPSRPPRAKDFGHRAATDPRIVDTAVRLGIRYRVRAWVAGAIGWRANAGADT